MNSFRLFNKQFQCGNNILVCSIFTCWCCWWLLCWFCNCCCNWYVWCCNCCCRACASAIACLCCWIASWCCLWASWCSLWDSWCCLWASWSCCSWRCRWTTSWWCLFAASCLWASSCLLWESLCWKGKTSVGSPIGYPRCVQVSGIFICFIKNTFFHKISTELSPIIYILFIVFLCTQHFKTGL